MWFFTQHAIGAKNQRQAVLATRAQTQAVQRADDLRSLVHSVIFDLNDAIVDLPGASPVRNKLLDSALVFLNRLALDADAIPGLQLELAQAYIRLGEVQGNQQSANLGDMPGAKQTYNRAIVSLEKLRGLHPDDHELLRALAKAYEQWSAVGAPEEEDGVNDPLYHEKALSIREALAESEPRNAAARWISS